jgi:hypothetical protein
MKSAEPNAAPDRGRMTVFRGSASFQRPRQVSFGVRRQKKRVDTVWIELVEVLREARGLLALPGNDFTWSSWRDARTALESLDSKIAAIERGERPPRLDLVVLFAPTGPIQEVSVSSGWGSQF